MSTILHLHVKTVYFEQIKSGAKTEEYRLFNRSWIKGLWPTLRAEKYTSIVIYNGYRPGHENRISFHWRGWVLKTMTHPHFGANPVRVFAIKLEVAGMTPRCKTFFSGAA